MCRDGGGALRDFLGATARIAYGARRFTNRVRALPVATVAAGRIEGDSTDEHRYLLRRDDRRDRDDVGNGDGVSNDKVDRVMQDAVDRLVEMMREGVADPAAWGKSWKGITTGLSGARNVLTGKHYAGGNAFNLAMDEFAFGRLGPWGTYRQWGEVGGQVRKGAHATWVLVPKPVTKDKGTEQERSFTLWGVAPLFPSSDVDGWTDDGAGTLVPADGWVSEVVHGAQVLVMHGHPACARNGSVVYMPDREMFTDEGAWFTTFAHELVHWSGHEGRAGERVKGSAFGDAAYAAEELCAELGAAMAAALVGVSAEPRADHAHYLAHWLRACEGERGPDFLFDVARASSKAVAWLDGRRVGVLVGASLMT